MPEKVPFRPLSEAVTRVGRAPSADSLTVFLMRLREQGWNLEPTVRRMKECGANLDPQVQGVVRLVSMAQDADKLGSIVWAKDPARDYGSWWPAEALDPWALPEGVVITPQQVLLLKSRERQQFLPADQSKGAGAGAAAEGCAAEGGAGDAPAAVQEGGEAAAVAGATGPGMSAGPPPGRRKFLVIFLGDRQASWVSERGNRCLMVPQRLFCWRTAESADHPPLSTSSYNQEWNDALLDYSAHRSNMIEKMRGLVKSRMIKSGKLFDKAVAAADKAVQVRLLAVNRQPLRTSFAAPLVLKGQGSICFRRRHA